MSGRAGLSAFGAGVLFAVGLAIAGMLDPARIQGFLDVSERWDPTLLWVMVGAIGTHGLLRQLVLRRQPRPFLTDAFPEHKKTQLDVRLVLGAAIFGVGWGLVGLCPGPAVAAVATGAPGVLTFVATMLFTLNGARVLEIWLAQRAMRQEPVVDSP